ncbi:MAG TPA: sulfotransferase [Sphingomicrobium sp.]|nr:sulfotransferase [Sphingomicrobium sp.]
MNPSRELAQAVEAFQGGDLDRARSLAEQGLAEAASPPLEHLLGLIHCRKGDPSKGVEHLRSAAEAEPGNAAFKLMLIRALVDSGRAGEVLAMPEPPPPSTPADLALWYARAEAADSAGEPEAAALVWSQLCDARPGDPRAWINLARSLLSLARYDEAEAAYRRALEIAPADVDALHELGLTYNRTNRNDELAALLDQALAAGLPKDRLAYLWALRLFRDGNADAALEQLLKAPREQDPARWHRLRAKIADSTGDEAAAFEAAKEMNRAVPGFARWRARSHEHRAQLRELAATITPEWAGRIRPLDPAESGAAPAFLVGFPRSGTTLLDTFLMGDPATMVLEEVPLLNQASKTAGPLIGLPDWPNSKLEEIRSRYLQDLAHLGDCEGKLVVDKFPINLQSAPLIHALFAGSPVIFAQRHPCDAVLSGFMQNFVPNLGMANFLDLEDSADFYDCLMSVWTASRACLGLNVRTVIYEELVTDPEPVLRGLLEFLGLAWDERVLDHRRTAEERGPVVTASFSQIPQPVTASAVGRWKRYEKQLEPVLPVLLPWAERLGYRD